MLVQYIHLHQTSSDFFAFGSFFSKILISLTEDAIVLEFTNEKFMKIQMN